MSFSLSSDADNPQEKLHQFEERLQSVVELSADWFCELDSEQRITLFKENKRRNLAYKLSLSSGLTWKESLHEGIKLDEWQPLDCLLDARQPFTNFVFRYSPNAENIFFISVSGIPIKDAHGAFKGYRCIGNDVTNTTWHDRRFQFEHAVLDILLSSHQLEDTIRQILVKAGELLECKSGTYWSWSNKAQSLRQLLRWSLQSANESVSEQTILPTDAKHLTNQCLQANGAIWERQHVTSAEDAITFAELAVPIKAQDNLFGVLQFVVPVCQEKNKDFASSIQFIQDTLSEFCLRVKSEKALRQSEARFRDLIDLSADWYWEQDENFRFTLLSGGFFSGTAEYKPTALIGKTRWEQSGVHLSENQWEEHKTVLNAHEPFQNFTYPIALPDGTLRYVATSGRPLFNLKGQFTGYRGVGRDVTERLQTEQRIQYMAYHDGLTSLPNRSMFNEMLMHGINRAQRYERKLAVLFIDLDRFKNINDTLGHAAGDHLLQEVADRLKNNLRKSDLVARLGGDEFVVLLEEIPDEEHVKIVAEKILSSISKPFLLQNQEFRVTGSVGIAIFPDHGKDGEILMKNADIALYKAKEEGKNNAQVYSEKINAYSFHRLTLESSLRGALDRNEFILHYQAKIDLQSSKINGIEALVRWMHPEFGLIPPNQFIPIAEETGLIVSIGRWVLDTACKQNKAWQDAGLPPIRVAVNLSARQFSDENLISDIVGILEQSGLAAEYLELEITESMVMQNIDDAVNLLTQLKGMGIRLAIDDFGVGYSSLATIKRFPIDTIKVDRSFIRDIPSDNDDKALTEAIIAMGKTLSLTVIAEGVETEEQLNFLKEKSCDEFQGFYFSKPLDKDQFHKLMTSYETVPTDVK